MLCIYFNFAGGGAIGFGGLGSWERNGAIWWQGEGFDQPIFSGHMATVARQPSGHVQMAGGSGETAGANGRPSTSGKYWGNVKTCRGGIFQMLNFLLVSLPTNLFPQCFGGNAVLIHSSLNLTN